MTQKIIKRVQVAIVITILSLFSLGVHQAFANAVQSEQADWLICEAKFIAEPTFSLPPVSPFFSPFSEWNPSMPLPDRPLTPAELAAWNAAFCEQGHISEIEREILRLTNIERAAYSLPPLTLNYALSRAARFKSQEMLDLNYFAHLSPVYGNWDNIPMLFINNHQGLGENLFTLLNWQPANITAAFFVQEWMNSEGHRANILRPELTELGVGVVIRPPAGASVMNATATQIFGHAVSASDHCICTMQLEQALATVENTSGLAGYVVDIAIYLDENPGLIGLQLDVDFNRDILNAVSITPGTLMPLPTQPTFPIAAHQPMGLTFEAAGFESIYGTGVLAIIRFEICPATSPGITTIQLDGIMAIGGEPNFAMLPLSTTSGTINIENVATSVHVSAINVTSHMGGYVDVTVNLTENPGLIGLQLDVDFNRDILTAVSITPGTLIPLPTPPTFPIPSDQPLGLTFEAAGFENIYGTGILATIRFHVAPGAMLGTTPIILDGIMAMSGEPSFEMLDISTENGSVSILTSLRDKLEYLITAAQNLQQNTRVSVTPGSNVPRNEFWAYQSAHNDFLTAIDIAIGVLDAYDAQTGQ